MGGVLRRMNDGTDPSGTPLPPAMGRALAILARQRTLAREALGGPPAAARYPAEIADMEANLRRAIAAIERAGAAWTLVGAEAVNLYARPRATEDVDILVAGGRFVHALEEIRREFGNPQEVDISAAVRLPELGIDLVRANSHPLFRIALERSRVLGQLRVPPPEVLLALKFLSSISPWRADDDRKQDAVDLIRVYRVTAPRLDRPETIRLCGMAYPGAEREISALLDKIDQGQDVSI